MEETQENKQGSKVKARKMVRLVLIHIHHRIVRLTQVSTDQGLVLLQSSVIPVIFGMDLSSLDPFCVWIQGAQGPCSI